MAKKHTNGRGAPEGPGAAPMLSRQQAAERLGVSPSTIHRWCKDPRSGFPRPYRFGPNLLRFDAAEIEAWRAARRGGGS